MRRIRAVCITVLVCVMLLSQSVFANMAAPVPADVGSAITFEKNDAISVTSEILNIAVRKDKADITAAYHMKNTTGETVTTPSMFLTPNVEAGGVSVTVAGTPVDFAVERYGISYSGVEITRRDWRYAVLSKWPGQEGGRSVDALAFELTFAPGEEYGVEVSYTYALGGYPDYNFNAKCGRIEYYLTPAALWKDFSDLTINLILDEDMPVITSSTVPFEKVGKRTFRYTSDTLPEEDLRITIDENWVQNIFSTLRSPYLPMFIPLLLLLGLPALIVIVMIRAGLKKRRKGS